MHNVPSANNAVEDDEYGRKQANLLPPWHIGSVGLVEADLRLDGALSVGIGLAADARLFSLVSPNSSASRARRLYVYTHVVTSTDETYGDSFA